MVIPISPKFIFNLENVIIDKILFPNKILTRGNKRLIFYISIMESETGFDGIIHRFYKNENLETVNFFYYPQRDSLKEFLYSVISSYLAKKYISLNFDSTYGILKDYIDNYNEILIHDANYPSNELYIVPGF